MNNNTPALDFFTKLSYSYVSESAIRDRYGYALVLQGNALGRFGQIAGWLTGLTHAGKAELAAKLADDFDVTLRGALMGCEVTPMDVITDYRDEVEGSVSAPRMKLVVVDDGTFGGFGLAYYRAISSYSRMKRARSLDPEAYDGDLPQEETQRRWRDALDNADKELRIRKDIEEYRYYTPTWANAETPSSIRTCSTVVHYGYVRNGGLLYHGPGGGEVFAVALGEGRVWRTHS